jgi:hypothetical protein
MRLQDWRLHINQFRIPTWTILRSPENAVALEVRARQRSSLVQPSAAVRSGHLANRGRPEPSIASVEFA